MFHVSIVYYGRRGLEADIFESYMRLSGYPVRLVCADDGAPEASNSPHSIAVISLGDDSNQVLSLAQSIRRQNGDCVDIFVLADPHKIQPDPLLMDVIARPNHLNQVVKRIKALDRRA